DLEGDRARRQGEVLAHLRVQLTGMAEDLPIGEDELRGPTRMPGSDLVGFDGDLESVRLRDPADRVDDIGGLGPATLAPDSGQLRIAGDDARVVVGLVRHRGVDGLELVIAGMVPGQVTRAGTGGQTRRGG